MLKMSHLDLFFKGVDERLNYSRQVELDPEDCPVQ